MNKTQDLIYLDANATTPVLPKAAQAVLDTMQHQFGNPSSNHITGLQAKQLMEQTRQAARKHLGSGGGKLMFTSGATEGIQTAIISSLIAAKQKGNTEGCFILYGATEHKAVPESLKHWNQILQINAEILAIPVANNGLLDFDFIKEKAANSILICTMAANNETGVYQDLMALDDTIRTANPDVFWMVDCVQALGKIPLSLADTSIDYAPFSGHKLYAPKGIGMLYIREGAPFTPFIAGGGQESGLRSGTENLPAMAGLKVILDMLNGDIESPFAKRSTLIEYRLQIITALQQAFGNIVLNHELINSLPTTLNFAVPGFSSKEIMDLFDAAGIRVSSGSACSSKASGSFVLDAMGLARWQSESAIRLSFGPAITKQEVDEACQRIILAASSLRHSCLLSEESLHGDFEQGKKTGLLQFKDDGACCWVYICPHTKQTLIVDPLPSLKNRLINLVKCQKLNVVALLDTHGHGDHHSNRDELVAELGLSADTCHLGWPKDSTNYHWQGHTFAALNIGDKQLLSIPTPGHTDDSHTFVLLDEAQQILFAFVGDTVLPGSIGRSNFPSSSTEALYHSLKSLYALLGDSCLLLSSHDYHNDFFTSFDVEIANNCLLRDALKNDLAPADFIARKTQLDATLNDVAGQTIMCGAYSGDSCAKAINEYSYAELEALLNSDKAMTLLDIREPYEFELSHTQNPVLNVPLTQLADFVANKGLDKSHPLVLICRSGSRSLVAAKALERLGFSEISHIVGGYALS